MRVSTSELSQGSLDGIMTAYNQFAQAEQVVNTGKQLNEPSDNPSGTAQVLNMNAQLAELTQYGTIINQANTFISTSTSALSSVTTLLTQARTIAVQAANSTNNPSAFTDLGNQIQDIITQIGNIGNSSAGGQYVFGGQRTTTPPFVGNGSGFTYVGGTAAGGDGNINLTIGQGETMTVNVTGDTVISPILTTLTQLQNDISTGNIQAVSNTDLTNIDAQSNNLSEAQANLGSQIDQLNQITERNALTTQNLTQFVSNIQDANIASSAVQLQTAQTAYQAALQSTTKDFQYSLLNFLQ